MENHFESDGNVLKVTISGRLVASCAEEFKSTMLERLKDARQILFNLKGMEHVDSSGLGALVSILQWENTNAGTATAIIIHHVPQPDLSAFLLGDLPPPEHCFIDSSNILYSMYSSIKSS